MFSGRGNNSAGRYAFDVLDGLRTGEYYVRVLSDAGVVLAVSESVAVTSGQQFLEHVNIPVAP